MFQCCRYTLARTTYAPPRVKLYKKTNEEVKTVSKTFLEVRSKVSRGEIVCTQRFPPFCLNRGLCNRGSNEGTTEPSGQVSARVIE